MRTILLWAARNAWLRRFVPRLWFARRAVRRFMPGEHLADALDAAKRLEADGIGAIFTHLGENLTDAAEADAVAAHYLDALDRMRERGIDGEISVKLTQLGLDLDPDLAGRHMAALASRARELDLGVAWIDMEGSAYTEPTIALYESLKPDHPNLGICLQAYLHRTAADVRRLLPLGPHIRMVKGAYDEPATIAYRTRAEVDAAYLAQCIVLLTEGGDRRGRLGLGTHDVRLIEQMATTAAAAGLGPDAFEVEMLYGIRADQQRRLAAAGHPTRTLIAYGEYWYPWYVRRLAERPANVLFILRQMVPW